MSELIRHDCDALLSQTGWVRALARQLTADAHGAEDLTQAALAAALDRPPPGDRSLRGWLAAIVRNLARHERRSANNRAARERAVAREEADSSDAQLLERLEVHRAVVEAVARLDEPYRTAILLRYFEGLSPAAIAARTGAPLRTVHTRLQRALTRLRVELDRAFGGDRRTWLLALIPFARGSEGWSTAAIGALVMDAKLKVAIAALAVGGVCSTFALWPEKQANERASLAVAATSERAVLQAPREPVREPMVDFTRLEQAREPVSSPESPEIQPETAVPQPLSGRVIDVENAPVPGIVVRLAGEQENETRTDADGRFELPASERSTHVDVGSPGWTSVFRPLITAEAGARELVLVVARSVTLGGSVIDEEQRALSGASIAVPVPFGMRARFDAILDASSTIERRTETAADGTFELRDVPLVHGANLVTEHAGYHLDTRELPQYDDAALTIVLHPARRAAERLVGTVIDPAGNPVEDAWVALGTFSTKSGPNGAFALELANPDDGPRAATLRAVKAGYLPAELSHEDSWPDPLVLELGGPPLEIRGRVLGPDGDPVSGAQVWTAEETHFGYIQIEGGEMSMRAGASVEGILRGDPWERRTRTDSAGRFELAGLCSRTYRVLALDSVHLGAVTETVAAGSLDVELLLPDEERHEQVAGRVTSLSGEPLSGLHVTLERGLAGLAIGELDRLESRVVMTDPDGRFQLSDVSRAADRVNVRGLELGVLAFQHVLRTEDDVENLAIAVPLRAHVQVDAGAQSGFDEIVVLDETGAELELSVQHGSSSYGMSRIRLQEGRSEPFSVLETARTIVFFSQRAEMLRVPLELERGELNAIRL